MPGGLLVPTLLDKFVGPDELKSVCHLGKHHKLNVPNVQCGDGELVSFDWKPIDDLCRVSAHRTDRLWRPNGLFCDFKNALLVGVHYHYLTSVGGARLRGALVTLNLWHERDLVQ